MSAAKDIQGPDPATLGDLEFDAILHLPVEPFTAVVLRDARWTHRGRWHLTGVLHGTPFDIEQVARMDMAEIIYNDKSSETLRFMVTDLAHRVEISEKRLSVYIQDAPRYPKGRDDTDRRGMIQRQIPALSSILKDYLPEIVDNQRRGWILDALTEWADREVSTAANKLARNLADQNDRHNALTGKIGDLVDDWLIDSDADNAVNYFTKISGLLERDEKGLPL